MAEAEAEELVLLTMVVLMEVTVLLPDADAEDALDLLLEEVLVEDMGRVEQLVETPLTGSILISENERI